MGRENRGGTEAKGGGGGGGDEEEGEDEDRQTNKTNVLHYCRTTALRYHMTGQNKSTVFQRDI